MLLLGGFQAVSVDKAVDDTGAKKGVSNYVNGGHFGEDGMCWREMVGENDWMRYPGLVHGWEETRPHRPEWLMGEFFRGVLGGEIFGF